MVSMLKVYRGQWRLFAVGQFLKGDSHGKFVVEEGLEVSL
jgi:hypothetical protein